MVSTSFKKEIRVEMWDDGKRGGVSRVSDNTEHFKTLVQLILESGVDWLVLNEEKARQLILRWYPILWCWQVCSGRDKLVLALTCFLGMYTTSRLALRVSSLILHIVSASASPSHTFLTSVFYGSYFQAIMSCQSSYTHSGAFSHNLTLSANKIYKWTTEKMLNEAIKCS